MSKLRNPLFVFIFSCGHKSNTISKITHMIHLYEAIRPHPFEYYCVFCRQFFENDCWSVDNFFDHSKRVIKDE
jgi:hypothetical protein